MNGITHSIPSISISVILLMAISAHAATVWNGPTISFTKSNYANPLLAENQDRLTTNVWITRGSAQGLFNAKTESGFTHYFSPAGTEWANGSLENYATLSYTNWNRWAKGVNPNPQATVGVQAVVHLIPDDIYLSVRFTSWSGGAPGGGPSYGGGFSYLRSTPATNTPPTVTIFEPLLLGNGHFQFSFTNQSSAVYEVLGTTNVSLPVVQWSVLGLPTHLGSGLYRFTTTGAMGQAQRFYILRAQ